jgi:hypothetical protein
MCRASRICEKDPAGLVLRVGRVFLALVSRWTSDLPDEAAAPPLGNSTNSSAFL